MEPLYKESPKLAGYGADSASGSPGGRVAPHAADMHGDPKD